MQRNQFPSSYSIYVLFYAWKKKLIYILSIVYLYLFFIGLGRTSRTSDRVPVPVPDKRVGHGQVQSAGISVVRGGDGADLNLLLFSISSFSAHRVHIDFFFFFRPSFCWSCLLELSLLLMMMGLLPSFSGGVNSMLAFDWIGFRIVWNFTFFLLAAFLVR